MRRSGIIPNLTRPDHSSCSPRSWLDHPHGGMQRTLAKMPSLIVHWKFHYAVAAWRVALSAFPASSRDSLRDISMRSRHEYPNSLVRVEMIPNCHMRDPDQWTCVSTAHESFSTLWDPTMVRYSQRSIRHGLDYA